MGRRVLHQSRGILKLFDEATVSVYISHKGLVWGQCSDGYITNDKTGIIVCHGIGTRTWVTSHCRCEPTYSVVVTGKGRRC